MNRIVITGMGAVTPIGIGVEEYWNGLLAGACGIGKITQRGTEELPVEIAAEVKGFDPHTAVEAKLIPNMDRFMLYACAAAEEALRASGLNVSENPARIGVVMGTALGGMQATGDTQAEMAVGGKKVGPRFLTKIMGNIAASQFSIAHGITGPSFTVSTACSSGGDALGIAKLLLRADCADAVVVMGGEAAVGPLMIDSLARAGALSRNQGSFPFDARRDGFVIGEGGGAVVLESAAHARARGAAIRAELLGSANNNDAHHVVAPEPTGAGAAACMRLALQDAGCAPRDIGYVNAHGTATRAGDLAETQAIQAVFGAHGVPVSSTKGSTGHLMGAGGLTELIACVRAIETGLLPHTVNLETPDPACAELDLVAGAPRKAAIDIAMSNAFGFGGQNSSVVVGRWQEN